VSIRNDADGISRILTLVFTDLADSTALKTQRGDQAVGALITRHRAHVRRLSADSGGRIIDWAGDGCFLTFETPSAAVLFALRLQQVHRDEPDLPGVRTGIHMGEVSERPGPDGDAAHPRVEGLAVDLAARISSLAKPGQILMSSPVADSARQRIEADAFLQPVRWRTHGSYALKGFDEALQIREAGLEGVAPFEAPAASEKATPTGQPGPVGKRRTTLPIAVMSMALVGAVISYRMLSRAPDRPRPDLPNPAGVATPALAAAAIPDFGGRPAIAVLPFDNLSPDPEQAFFADGLAEDLITRLSAWRAFPVIARNSSFHYRGGNRDLKRVSAELGVRYIVEGSVRRAGNRIRVAAQLIDAPSAEHVWAETYDREIEDVFALQDEISATIAASLVGDLDRAEAERARQRGTENLEAWSLYQLGLQHADRLASEDLAEARGLFERAVVLDPQFATALGRLALTHLWEVAIGSGDAPKQKVSAALVIARRAVALDPRDAVAQVAQGWAYVLGGDLKNGLDSSRRAVELNPSMPDAWTWLGWIQVLAGDPEAGIASSERARRLSPQGPSVAQVEDNSAMAYFEMGRHAEALEAGRKLVALRPAYVWGYAYIAMSAAALGRVDEARAAVTEARRVEPRVSLEMFQRGMGVSRPEIDARRNAALRQAGLE
jgi:TolB-like protein/class 3 adenylate cyclase/Flp pilus assembly protein TadD